MDTYDTFRAHTRERQRALAEQCSEIFVDHSCCTLEIGCGHGHFLVAYAEAHGEEFCVGLDLLNKRIEKAVQKKVKKGLSNLSFLKAEAGEFLDALPSAIRLKRIFFLFPDPWPKRRHHKNRLMQTAFLQKLAEFAVPQGQLYFRTDHRLYYQWTLEGINAHLKWKLHREAPWPFEEETYFQQIMKPYYSLVAIRIDPSRKLGRTGPPQQGGRGYR